jgi:hypothetical protein
MIRHIRSLSAPLALSLALVAGACGGGGDDDALTQDSALNRDLALANQDTAAQPQLQDVPATEPEATPAPKSTPSRTTPTRTPTRTPSRTTTPKQPSAPTTPSGNRVETGEKGSEGATASIAAGTTINLTSGDRVCTNTHRAGDRFTATVTEPVVGPNGATIPAGARAVVQVSSVKRSENANDPIQMGFVVQSISWGGKTYPIDASITDVQVDRVRASSTGNDAKKVIGGAVAGAIIGQILGKDTKSTVIGAATGAAAGTAVAMGTADYEGCVPQGGRIQVRLNSPATIQAD